MTIYKYRRVVKRAAVKMLIVPFFAFGGIYYISGAYEFESKMLTIDKWKYGLVFLTNDREISRAPYFTVTIQSQSDSSITYAGSYVVYNNSVNTILITRDQHLWTIVKHEEDVFHSLNMRLGFALKNLSFGDSANPKLFLELKPENYAMITMNFSTKKNREDSIALTRTVYFNVKYMEKGEFKELLEMTSVRVTHQKE